MDPIELPPCLRTELEQIVVLIEKRKELLDGLQHRTVLAMIANIPPALDSALDAGIGQVRDQLAAAERAGTASVALRADPTAGMVELVEWALARYEHARRTIFPGSLPAEWERTIEVYARFLDSAARQLGIA